MVVRRGLLWIFTIMTWFLIMSLPTTAVWFTQSTRASVRQGALLRQPLSEPLLVPEPLIRSKPPVAGEMAPEVEMGQTIPRELPRFAQVVSGDEFSCGLSTTGGALCWGNNSDGQLGDGTARAYRPVVSVVGLQRGVQALAAGDRHACALLDDRSLRCWGSNDHGQIGNAARETWTEPTAIPSITESVQMVALGGEHSCALMESGAVLCWGRNDVGQLGSGDTAAHAAPVVVNGLAEPVATLVAGVAHTCALFENGTLRCWGANRVGQLGDGTQQNQSSPVAVSGFTQRVQHLAAGSYHTCAILADSTTWCWGDNERGQLGIPTQNASAMETPVAVGQLPSTLMAVSLGRYHSCGVDTAGAVYCWGSNNRGLLGDGTKTLYNQPVQVIGLPASVTSLAAGEEHTCVLDSVGEILCWGSNRDRQLGEGSADSRSIPVQVNPTTPIQESRSIVPGTYHTCLITSEGGVQCWGRNNDGQLGNGTSDAHTTPVDVVGLPGGVTALALGTDHTCALVQGGVKCWGDNLYGQLGLDATPEVAVPTDVPGLGSGVTAIAAGAQHTCALVGSTELRCWGRNQWGQLGNNSTTDSALPVAVQQLNRAVTGLVAGTWHSCVRLDDGTARCWGDNRFGQLGDGTVVNRPAPVVVSGLPTAVATLGAGERHTCALTGGGAAYCWGGNDVGQLGNGTVTGQMQPVAVEGLATPFTALAVGALHTCGFNEVGSVACWGGNLHNQTGNGLPNARLHAEGGDGLLGNVAALHAGGYHNCALLENHAPRCWGRDGDGQLGSGIRAYSAVPLALSNAEPASIHLNYSSGQPSSYFTLFGTGLPYSSTVSLTVNDVTMADPIPVNSSGEFIVFLDTTDLPPGTYQLVVNQDQALALTLLLLETGEHHRLEGGGTVITLSDVIGTGIKTFYLPFITR